LNPRSLQSGASQITRSITRSEAGSLRSELANQIRQAIAIDVLTTATARIEALLETCSSDGQ
jgi:hypothetical protein